MNYTPSKENPMVVKVIIAYLLIGLIAVIIFELSTKRIRNRIKNASYDTQEQIVNTTARLNTPTIVTYKVALVMTLISIWIFYPFLLWSALRGKLEKRGKE